MVRHSVFSGSPANSAACLAGACPCPAVKTLPIITSLTALASILESSITALMAILPNFPALRPASAPLKDPTGVLLAAVITTFFILSSIV
ncbi:hypothetical protein BMS3Abin03_00671 [bacterium BMS3Abin03]|nr:hypothetical protein BMS3Abin03_00671 [bacterium BMS3Abin03]